MRILTYIQEYFFVLHYTLLIVTPTVHHIALVRCSIVSALTMRTHKKWLINKFMIFDTVIRSK